MKHIKYVKYIARHKWYVFLSARKLGITWLGIIHDWSKLTPGEWVPYTEYFYGEGSEERREANKNSKPEDTGDVEFDAAWLHHIHWNKHHWQHYILSNDDGPVYCLPMPEKYLKEMLADWVGAGMAISGRKDAAPWYLKNKDKIKLHKDSRRLAEEIMGVESYPWEE